MIRSTRRRGALLVAVMGLAAVGVGGQTNAGSGSRDKGDFTAKKVSASSRVSGAKSRTGALAESDPALLGRTDAALVNVVVKLDYDATASYQGGIKGLAATSPKITGKKLTGKSAAEKKYETYTASMERGFKAQLKTKVPAARVGRSLTRVYGGVALQLPANQIGKLLSLPNVAAVQSDSLNELDTDSSAAFIGAPAVWAQNGGQAMAGHGVIFGDLDSGVWPEHPSFADNPALGSPPPAPSGLPRACNFGDNPLTGAVDLFVCNQKLIGGQPFIGTYNAVIGGEVYGTSARDSNGHGTHTTTTAAGGIVASTPIFGTDHGPISGVAPGAWVMAYKVCGVLGCFSSDSASAVEQAILDGVSVINFSISGGVNPYGDVVELAFLDAYDAGILVAASAGNEGPGAGTTNHLGPWTLTVAASTQTREFQSTLTLTDGGTSTSLVGASITSGISSATPVVLAENIAGYERDCLTELPPGAATGVIVACRRGIIGRVQKGFNVAAGGAAGMILYNLPLQDIETDNHYLPTVHLADGTAFLAFMAGHPTATATFTAGTSASGQGDVMAAFSSRGPGGQFLKPDVTAPGVQILAGHTPTPDEVSGGPAGEYFQAIAGTSMSSPHAAGAAILLKSLHPGWSPGAIKSALMTTATTSVVKEDLLTPADPFDFGAGRIDLTQAGKAGIVFDESASDMYFLGSDPVTAVNVNLPSINVPIMPGTIKITRTATNVTNEKFDFKASVIAPPGATIKIKPDKGNIKPGNTETFTITITSNAPSGQYFGQIMLTPKTGPAIHLPVAFYNQQGAVSLSQSCSPTTFKQKQTTTCTVTTTNDSFGDASVKVESQVGKGLKLVSATGASVKGDTAKAGPIVLAGKSDAVPAITQFDTGSDLYLDLAIFEPFGVTLDPIGDEEAINYSVPPFLFGGKTYTSIGQVSNGYAVLGGTTSAADIDFIPQDLPDPAPPNGVLAPYWTDLEGGTGYGVRAAILADGPLSWLVLQWNLHLWGDTSPGAARNFQMWIGLNGYEDVSYSYPADSLVGTSADYGLTVGAENESGTGGAQIVGAPLGTYLVTTSPGTPGGSLSYTMVIEGKDARVTDVTSTMTTDIVAGKAIVVTPLTVTKK